MLKMSMNAWKDHMTAFQTSPTALTFLAHITVRVCSHSYTEDNTCLPEGTEY